MNNTSSSFLIYVIIIIAMNLMVKKIINNGRIGVGGLEQPDALELIPQQSSQSWEKPKYKQLASSSSHPGSGDSLPPLQAY